jgi:hypothetical protein
MPAGAALFRDGGIGPESRSFLSTLALSQRDVRAVRTDPAAALKRYEKKIRGLGKSPAQLAALMYRNVEAPASPPGRPFFLVSGAGGGVAAGYGADFEAWTGGRIVVEAPEFCAVTLAAMDRRSVGHSRRLLVTGCGRAENTGMEFNKKRTTVGRRWGRPPVRAEAVKGRLRLPPGNWKAWALKPDGTRSDAVPLQRSADGKHLVLPMDPAHRTLSYWLER